MDLSLSLLMGAIVGVVLNRAEQARRVALLGRCLQPLQIESLLETLTDGYLRAMGEDDPQRRQAVWQVLQGHETRLVQQLDTLARDVAQLDAASTRASAWPVALPLMPRLLPGACFDLRAALRVHADGVAHVALNAEGLNERDRAFRLSAELLLFQHTCHRFCRSRGVASARLLARHRTSLQQVLAAVSPHTRDGLAALGLR